MTGLVASTNNLRVIYERVNKNRPFESPLRQILYLQLLIIVVCIVCILRPVYMEGRSMASLPVVIVARRHHQVSSNLGSKEKRVTSPL